MHHPPCGFLNPNAGDIVAVNKAVNKEAQAIEAQAIEAQAIEAQAIEIAAGQAKRVARDSAIARLRGLIRC
jgi:hypothetical protein